MIRAALWAACAIACSDDATRQGPVRPVPCAISGTAYACTAYESLECPVLVEAPGGWFSDHDGALVIELAPDAQGLELAFALDDLAGLVDGNRYDLPEEAGATLRVADGDYTACTGELWVTHYLPGEEIWGSWTLGAGRDGACAATDSYRSRGDFINLLACPAPR